MTHRFRSPVWIGAAWAVPMMLLVWSLLWIRLAGDSEPVVSAAWVALLALPMAALAAAVWSGRALGKQTQVEQALCRGCKGRVWRTRPAGEPDERLTCFTCGLEFPAL